MPCENAEDSFFQGTIDVYEMLGYTAILHVKTDDGKIVSSIEENDSYKAGAPIYFRLNEDHIHLFDIESGKTICN